MISQRPVIHPPSAPMLRYADDTTMFCNANREIVNSPLIMKNHKLSDKIFLNNIKKQIFRTPLGGKIII